LGYYLERYVGTYSSYLMPVLGAWLDTRTAHWEASRLVHSETDVNA
jgi:hypothetical protein